MRSTTSLTIKQMATGITTDFKFKDGNRIFFTSDTHFNHEHILKFCNRPFETLESMNETIINNWNKVVPADGLVFHLGDFAWGDYNGWKKIRETLNGEIILIKGNHDFRNGPRSKTQWDSLFKYTTQQLYIKIENRKLFLNHCPLLCYGGIYRQPQDLVYQLFGHVHLTPSNNKGKDADVVFNSCWPTQYDVGVDLNGFTPIPWETVKDKIDTQVKENKNISMWIEQ